MEEILAAPQPREKFAAQGAEPGKLTVADLTKSVDTEIGKWPGVVKTAKVQQQ